MFLIVMTTLFGALSAQMVQTPTSKGCCMPKQYTTTMIQVGASQHPLKAPQLTDARVILDVDYDLKMERLQMVDVNTMVQTDVWLDYNNAKSYAVVNGQCYVTPYMVPMNSPCLDANSTYQGTYTMGTGDKMITVDDWSIVNNGFHVNIQVQGDTCTTVSMQTFGDLKDGSKELMTFVFTNIKKNVFSMANPFTMPDSCNNPIMPADGK